MVNHRFIRPFALTGSVFSIQSLSVFSYEDQWVHEFRFRIPVAR